MGALLVASAVGACREPAARPEVPPLTTAATDGGPLSSTAVAATPAGEGGTGPSVLAAALEPPIHAKFVDTPANLHAELCLRVLVAVVKGKVTAMGEALAAGDVLVVAHGGPFDATGTGTVVWAGVAIPDCAILSRPSVTKVVVRGATTPKVEWAGGTMSARFDVTAGPKAPSPAPELYLGRLEGTAAVPEHNHPTSWEILAAVEANGTFVLDGTERRLSSRQIVMVPPGAKHAWKPEPGSKLVAVQIYSPPGPEQRFVALAAADKSAVKDAGAPDAR
jgi:quercetin dioxygenase-like cupin family protein